MNDVEIAVALERVIQQATAMSDSGLTFDTDREVVRDFSVTMATVGAVVEIVGPEKLYLGGSALELVQSMTREDRVRLEDLLIVMARDHEIDDP